MSLISIFAVVGLVGAGTYAYFSNSGTSSGNTFSTGTLDLKLTDADQVVEDNVIASFGGSLAPGQCTTTQNLKLRNSGTIAADHAEVHLSNVVSDANTDAEPDIDTFLKLTLLDYDASNKLGQISETNGNGFVDLEDWAAPANAGVLDNLPLADLATDHNLDMIVCLDSTAGNVLQGDSVTSTFTVELNQHSSQ